MGASGSLLMAIIFSDDCIPTRCCIAPEIPTATYNFGATVRPVCPTWCAWSIQPSSTGGRDDPTAPPSKFASFSIRE